MKNDDYTGIVILACIGLMLAALVWAGLTDPELKARRNGTWVPPRTASHKQSDGHFFAEDPYNITPNPVEDHQRRDGWHFNRLNGQWNPGLWTDAQHAIIFDDD